MTEQEAIKYLKDGWVGSCYQSAKLMAIEALEKQIPKKVVSYSDDESDHVYCPCCNECIGSNDIIYEDFYYRGFAPMHCQECGQAMILR